jgi:hypothetical protein
MLKTVMICMLCLSGISCFAQKQVNLKSLLEELQDNTAVAKWPNPYYKELQASSYDRKSISAGKPGWFANDDRSQYIRSETNDGRKELVMMDADGPGAVVRFWLTTFKRNGIIRIYFDNNKTPEITIPSYDLMKIGLDLGTALLQAHSSYEAKEKGGSTLYLPLPYVKHCKITFEDNDPDNQPRYYQVNYRAYAPGTNVKTFSLQEFKTLEKLAAAVNEKLLHPDSIVNGSRTHLQQEIKPGQQAALKLPVGAAAIRYMVIKITTANAQDYEQALRSTILKIKFDGQETVWCPLGDFAGSGVGSKSLQSWYRTVKTDGSLISRWVMPYQANAEISLQNLSTSAVNASLSVITDRWKWNTNSSMYFHANWKGENNVAIKQTEQYQPMEWDFNEITGKGVFIGDTFAVYNHMHKWYGEGDQKLWTDNIVFPDEYGTGTEDYYNTSWAPVVLYQTPFANAPRADNADSFGYNTFTRTRNLDVVPFKDHFRYSLEMLGWKNGTADCAATTYWYGFKNAKSNITKNQPKPSLLPANTK